MRAIGTAWGLAAVCCAFLLGSGPAEAALGPQAGVTAAVRGRVLLTEIDQPQAAPETATNGTAIYLGHDIHSGADAGTQLMLLDQTSVTLGENAELAVNDFVYDPAANVGQLAVSVRNGAFRLVTGGISEVDPANTVIRTPTATIGVRGTILLSRVTPAGSLIALAGPGAATDTRDRVGAVEVTTEHGSVLLTRPGFATFVAPGKAPEAPRPLTPEESASLDQELSHEGSRGQVMAFAPTGRGDTAGDRRAMGGMQVGALASGRGSSATATALGTGLAQGTRNGTTGTAQTLENSNSSRLPSPNDPRFPPSNIQGQGDPTQPWFPQDGGNEDTNLSLKRMRDFFRPTDPFALTAYSGTATYVSHDIPIYHLVTNNPADYTWGFLQDFDNIDRFGTYDFQATVDFDRRVITARFFNAVLDNRIRIAEIATLRGTLADDTPLTWTADHVAVADSTALATARVELMNSREGDAARLMRQTLILEQGGAVFGNVTNIKGIGPMWEGLAIDTTANGLDTAPPGLPTEGGAYAAFSGVASFAQTAIPLNIADINGAFARPAGSYDLGVQIDFGSREMVINATNFHFQGDGNTYGATPLVHSLTSGLAFFATDIPLEISAGSGPDGLYMISDIFTQVRNVTSAPEDIARLLLQTVKISVDGTPAYQGTARLLGDFTNVVRP